MNTPFIRKLSKDAELRFYIPFNELCIKMLSDSVSPVQRFWYAGYIDRNKYRYCLVNLEYICEEWNKISEDVVAQLIINKILNLTFK